MNQILLEAKHLHKSYTQHTGILGLHRTTIHALKDVSLKIEQGQTLAVVGESGSGKSTLARGLMRLLPLDSGEVHFNGCDFLGLDASGLRRARRQIQMIFQDPFASLNPRMRIADILAEGLLIHGLGDKSSRTQQVITMLEKVGLKADDAKKYPHQFSGGQRQRIGIARALIVEPKLIICDEPVSALDVSVQAQILLLLKQLQHEMKLSYLFITHDLRVVRHIANQVMVMQKGKVIEQGSVENIYNAPQEKYTQQLLNAIPGHSRLIGVL